MHSSMRLGSAITLLALLGWTVAGCSTSHPLSVVALGDSVPRGTNCECRPYPPLSAADLAAKTRRLVTATNDAVGGATTASVLDQVKSDHRVIAHLREASAIEIEVGANDVSHSKECGTNVECYARRLPSLQKNLAEIMARVHKLTSGRKAIVVLLDYWNVWLGGKYAAAQGPAYVSAAEEMTDRVNAIIKATAAHSGSLYVDLRAAFKGPTYAYDETQYLSNDGDHPNEAGHKQIAKALESVLNHKPL